MLPRSDSSPLEPSISRIKSGRARTAFQYERSAVLCGRIVNQHNHGRMGNYAESIMHSSKSRLVVNRSWHIQCDSFLIHICYCRHTYKHPSYMHLQSDGAAQQRHWGKRGKQTCLFIFSNTVKRVPVRPHKHQHGMYGKTKKIAGMKSVSKNKLVWFWDNVQLDWISKLGVAGEFPWILKRQWNTKIQFINRVVLANTRT